MKTTVEGVKPTRMELLRSPERDVFAKEYAFVVQFFELIPLCNEISISTPNAHRGGIRAQGTGDRECKEKGECAGAHLHSPAEGRKERNATESVESKSLPLQGISISLMLSSPALTRVVHFLKEEAWFIVITISFFQLIVTILK